MNHSPLSLHITSQLGGRKELKRTVLRFGFPPGSSAPVLPHAMTVFYCSSRLLGPAALPLPLSRNTLDVAVRAYNLKEALDGGGLG